MTHRERAEIATKVFYADLAERGGFREVIAQIPAADWKAITDFKVGQVERALAAAEPAAVPSQRKLDFL